MKTILIPVDFSAASDNALNYAASFAKDAPVSRIILLKSCYVSIYTQLLPSADYVQLCEDDFKAERESINEQLNKLTQRLQHQVGPQIKVEKAISELSLLRAINSVVEEEEPDLIILGSDHNSYDNESYIGQQLIKIARTSIVSLLVIPSDYTYQPVKRVLLACDFKTILKTAALNSLETRYNWLHPQLLVLNVNNTGDTLEEQRNSLENQLSILLKNYQYETHFVSDPDTLHGITNFANANNVQMIIALPGRHSFLYTLTHGSITAGLASNANYPVLVLK